MTGSHIPVSLTTFPYLSSRHAQAVCLPSGPAYPALAYVAPLVPNAPASPARKDASTKILGDRKISYYRGRLQ